MQRIYRGLARDVLYLRCRRSSGSPALWQSPWCTLLTEPRLRFISPHRLVHDKTRVTSQDFLKEFEEPDEVRHDREVEPTEDENKQNEEIDGKYTTFHPPKEYSCFPELFQNEYRDFTSIVLNHVRFDKSYLFHGFLGKRRDKSSNLTFCDLDVPSYKNPTSDFSYQIVSDYMAVPEGPERDRALMLHKTLRSIPSHSPVAIVGRVQAPPGFRGPVSQLTRYDVVLEAIECLNPFPRDIIVSKDVKFPPQARHLHLRFDPFAVRRLEFRDRIIKRMRHEIAGFKFTEIETPLLFKPTPEGAREFLVPTRKHGFAYALSQSPQQYKQMLMASGVARYYQLARCFRDEDSRADRQPEFTQLDMEMSFADGKEVRTVVSRLVSSVLYEMTEFAKADWDLRHTSTGEPPKSNPWPGENEKTWPWALDTLTYKQAMTRYGSDKPDLRIPHIIKNMTGIVSEEFVRNITHLQEPIVEATVLRLNASPTENSNFIRQSIDTMSKPMRKVIDRFGIPAVLTYDTTKPMNGLSSLGPEAAMEIPGKPWQDENQGLNLQDLQHGDVILVNARPKLPFEGEGSTILGTLRKFLYDAAACAEMVQVPDVLHFAWIIDFPMFTPGNQAASATDAGMLQHQGKTGPFKSVHHPFTAPKDFENTEFLRQGKIRQYAIADAYDLVLNGVEIGGGSARIHYAPLQEYVLREILRLDEKVISRFDHLLRALRAGCPPHAGFALGIDRFIATLLNHESVRDVMAFPKSVKGEDLMVQSPDWVDKDVWKDYGLVRVHRF